MVSYQALLRDVVIKRLERLEIAGLEGGGGQSDAGMSPHRASDPEAGVARGIDFHHVCAVLNFDLPPTPEAYIHRAGR